VAQDDGQQGDEQQNRVHNSNSRGKRYTSQHTRASSREDRWAGWAHGKQRANGRLRWPSDATAMIDRKGKLDSTAASKVEYTSSIEWCEWWRGRDRVAERAERQRDGGREQWDRPPCRACAAVHADQPATITITDTQRAFSGRDQCARLAGEHHTCSRLSVGPLFFFFLIAGLRMVYVAAGALILRSFRLQLALIGPVGVLRVRREVS
jgi:hypothetical protein